MARTADEITVLRIGGFRVVESLDLDLRALTVLVGENGSGKSTLLEALDLLRLAAGPQSFVQESLARHGALDEMTRDGTLRVGVRIEGPSEPPIEYGFTVQSIPGSTTSIVEEHLDLHADAGAPLHVIVRDTAAANWLDLSTTTLNSIPHYSNTQLMLTAFGRVAQPAFVRVVNVLERIQVRTAPDVRKLFTGALGATRRPNEVEGTARLDRGGANLANAMFTLAQVDGPVWDQVLDRARAALGIVDIKTPPFQRGGIDLACRLATGRVVPATQLSDGQLAYLSLLAVAGLRTNGLLAIDEPETHLHPALLQRLVWVLEAEAEKGPVLVATQSDGLLDALSAPADQVVLCSRNAKGTTTIERPNAERLAAWLRDYRGLGALRADGHDALVFEGKPT